MRQEKSIAIKLRKQGKSYSQISGELNVPKSTLSVWLKDVKISLEAKNKIQERIKSTSLEKLIERNKNRPKIIEIQHNKLREAAKIESKKYLKDPLFIAGLSLYWGEGYKRGAEGSKWKSIDFTNSDSEMIQVMVKFFVKFFKITPKEMRAQIMLHDSSKTTITINYWSKITGIPAENFIKTCHSISSASKLRVAKKLEFGTIHLRINDVKMFFRLIGWMDGLKSHL
ncbi:MAG: helix-turn-helix domain containing protein [Candidatus Gracilibacteria bacterium]|nr:helix-turn-helix domain containing protein [Candidatus Gracilibacteria bacterium]